MWCADATPHVPLAGETRHDFGERTFGPGEPLEMTHTFELTNTTASVLRIAKVTSSCGCTHAEPGRTEIGPGDTVPISVTLKFNGLGRKTETVWIALDDGSVHKLAVTGLARSTIDFYVAERSVRLRPGRTAVVTFFATSRDDAFVPAIPTAETPPCVTATVSAWTLVHPIDAARGLPARWQGTAWLEATGEAPDRAITLRWRDREERVLLDGYPWD